MSSPPNENAGHPASGNKPHDARGSHSPRGPPYSPITPEQTFTALYDPSRQRPPRDPVERPLLTPISESDNPDAIALRSAISVLQLQRLQSLRDLKRLEEQKNIAFANSEQFARDLGAGKIKTALSGSALIAPAAMQQPSQSVRLDWEDMDTEDAPPRPASSFGDIPGPQNVVRCPPINWVKYHVVGEPLNQLHERQTKNPSSELEAAAKSVDVLEASVLAPYSPWMDKASRPQGPR